MPLSVVVRTCIVTLKVKHKKEATRALREPFKKLAVIFSVGLFVATALVNLNTSAFSGSGTGLDLGEEYIITTCTQLQEMADDLNAFYALGNDIDCSMSATWNSGAGFNPVGDDSNKFIGRLEGNRHTISNLTINRPNEDYVGLFGYMGQVSSILNTRLKNISIVGDEYVGAVAGATTFGDILGVAADGSVNGNTSTGGLAGLLTGTIIHGYANVEVTSDAAPSGGLVGESTGIILTSYSRGLVNSTGADHGGLVGVNTGDPITDSFWDTQTSSQSTSDGGTGKTSDEMKDISTYTDGDTVGLDNPWDFNSIWGINPLINQGYPYLNGQTPGVPDTFITESSPTPANTEELTFEFASNVEPSTFECKVEPVANGYEACTSPYVFPTEGDGTYAFSVRATNSDGIMDVTPAQRDITVDTVAPTATLTRLGDAPDASPRSKFSFGSDEQPVTFRCQLDNTGYKLCQNPFTTPSLNDGEHTVYIKAVDAAGNISPTADSHTWTVNSSLFDSDGDSILDVVENAGPNGGDGNNDGTPDVEQPTVASFVNPITNNYQVIVANACDNFISVMTGAESDDPADAGYDYPAGLTSFFALCGGPGQVGSFEQYFYGIEGNDGYMFRKWVDGVYSTMEGAIFEGVTIDGQTVMRVSYQIEDGDENDEDGEVNGYIKDPAGIALEATPSPNSVGLNESVLAGTGDSTLAVLVVSSILILLGAARFGYRAAGIKRRLL